VKTTVCILATCLKPELLPAATLVFKTLRTGFPNADVLVSIQTPELESDHPLRDKIVDECVRTGAQWELQKFDGFLKHPAWIRDMLSTHRGRLVLLDTDIVFWKNCEDFDFDADIAGYRCPKFYAEMPPCITMPRLHTSFLWFRNSQDIYKRYRARQQGELTPPFTPYDPFTPFVYYHDGVMHFQDTATGLCDLGTVGEFTERHLKHYDHLNCGTIIDVVSSKMQGGKDMLAFHKGVYENPELLRGAWKLWDTYYKTRSVKPPIRLHSQLQEFSKSYGVDGVPIGQILAYSINGSPPKPPPHLWQ